MLNVDITYNLLSQLSEHGIGIYVDDFGLAMLLVTT
jgi:EAL domain-containing protein (putative c-di-GMP-specific phosphodiesterase class I)